MIPGPRAEQIELLKTAPLDALKAQPSIAFALGGIAIDAGTRVLDADGAPVCGLFAAGADIGRLPRCSYVGGLRPARISGRLAGHAASVAAKEA